MSDLKKKKKTILVVFQKGVKLSACSRSFVFTWKAAIFYACAYLYLMIVGVAFLSACSMLDSQIRTSCTLNFILTVTELGSIKLKFYTQIFFPCVKKL